MPGWKKGTLQGHRFQTLDRKKQYSVGLKDKLGNFPPIKVNLWLTSEEAKTEQWKQWVSLWLMFPKDDEDVRLDVYVYDEWTDHEGKHHMLIGEFSAHVWMVDVVDGTKPVRKYAVSWVNNVMQVENTQLTHVIRRNIVTVDTWPMPLTSLIQSYLLPAELCVGSLLEEHYYHKVTIDPSSISLEIARRSRHLYRCIEAEKQQEILDFLNQKMVMTNKNIKWFAIEELDKSCLDLQSAKVVIHLVAEFYVPPMAVRWAESSTTWTFVWQDSTDYKDHLEFMVQPEMFHSKNRETRLAHYPINKMPQQIGWTILSKLFQAYMNWKTGQGRALDCLATGVQSGPWCMTVTYFTEDNPFVPPKQLVRACAFTS